MAGSALAANATIDPDQTKVFRVESEGENFPVLVTASGKGYKLSCGDNVQGLLKLITSTGYPENLIAFSQEIKELKIVITEFY